MENALKYIIFELTVTYLFIGLSWTLLGGMITVSQEDSFLIHIDVELELKFK